ncbi:MAG TPA: hypothetical protein VGE39_05735 [Prosthecobacter sp.]
MARDPDQSFRVCASALRFSIIFFPMQIFVGLVWWKSGLFIHAVPYFLLAIIAGLWAGIRTYLQLGKLMREIKARNAANQDGGKVEGCNGSTAG